MQSPISHPESLPEASVGSPQFPPHDKLDPLSIDRENGSIVGKIEQAKQRVIERQKGTTTKKAPRRLYQRLNEHTNSPVEKGGLTEDLAASCVDHSQELLDKKVNESSSGTMNWKQTYHKNWNSENASRLHGCEDRIATTTEVKEMRSIRRRGMTYNHGLSDESDASTTDEEIVVSLAKKSLPFMFANESKNERNKTEKPTEVPPIPAYVTELGGRPVFIPVEPIPMDQIQRVSSDKKSTTKSQVKGTKNTSPPNTSHQDADGQFPYLKKVAGGVNSSASFSSTFLPLLIPMIKGNRVDASTQYDFDDFTNPDVHHLFGKRVFWTQFDPSVESNLPEPPIPGEPFDLYIDAIRFIPNNVKVFKMVAKLVRSGGLPAPDELSVFPQMNSFRRTPAFNGARLCVPKFDRKAEDLNSFISLKLYALDEETGGVVICARTALKVFQQKRFKIKDKVFARKSSAVEEPEEEEPTVVKEKDKHEAYLCLGGHQLRMFQDSQIVAAAAEKAEDSGSGGGVLSSTSRQDVSVPGLTVLVRLLPHQDQVDLKMPEYDSGYYRSADCEPNDSEIRIISHYMHIDEGNDEPGDNSQDFQVSQAKDRLDGGSSTVTIQEAAKQVRSRSKDADTSQEGESLEEWMQSKLNTDKLDADDVRWLNLDLLVYYDIYNGLNIKIEQAFGVGGAVYSSVYCYLQSGEATHQMAATPEGWGDDHRYLTDKHDYGTTLSAPAWKDPPMKFHPRIDRNTVAIFVLLNLDTDYEPDPDLMAPGTLKPRNGDELTLEKENFLGWTAANLFDGKSVNAGIHYLPFFAGPPNVELLALMQQHSVRECIHSKEGRALISRVGHSLKTQIYDGCYISPKDLYPLKEKFDLVADLSTGKRFTKMTKVKGVTKLQDKVLATMKRKYQNRGPVGERYNISERLFEKAHSDTMFKLVKKDLYKHVRRIGEGKNNDE